MKIKNLELYELKKMLEPLKRVTVVVGHFGSGKTEFSVNLTYDLKNLHDNVAILDMDIANPYFRSRERQQVMEERGIAIHHNSFGYDITEDLPAISATMKAPLENKDFITVVDVGGDDSGARVLNQFRKYFLEEDSKMLCVLNGNRPETDTVEGMLEHMGRIQYETGLQFDGIVNNTHLLRETEPKDIMKGYRLCKEIEAQTEIPLLYNTCRVDLVPQLETVAREEIAAGQFIIYPIELQMRPSWLDR